MICSKAYWTTDFSPSGVKLEAPLWDRFWTVFSRWGTKLWPVPTWYGHDAMISWENCMGMSDYKTISSLRILKVVLSRNWRYGWYTLKWQFSWTNMLILILVFWCKKPWSSWARRLATTWSSGMVVCLASLTSWRRSEDVIMQMVWVWYHGKNIGKSWEYAGIWSYLYNMVLRTLWEKTYNKYGTVVGN